MTHLLQPKNEVNLRNFSLQNFWIASPMIAWPNTKYQSACLNVMPHFRAACTPTWCVTFRNLHGNHLHSFSDDWASTFVTRPAYVGGDTGGSVAYSHCWGTAIIVWSYMSLYASRSVVYNFSRNATKTGDNLSCKVEYYHLSWVENSSNGNREDETSPCTAHGFTGWSLYPAIKELTVSERQTAEKLHITSYSPSRGVTELRSRTWK